MTPSPWPSPLKGEGKIEPISKATPGLHARAGALRPAQRLTGALSEKLAL